MRGKTLEMNFHNYFRLTRNSIFLPFIVIGSLLMSVLLSAEDIVEEQFPKRSGGEVVTDVVFTKVFFGRTLR